MTEKKDASITIKTTPSTKKALEEICEEKDWSISKLCDKILTEYVTSREVQRP